MRGVQECIPVGYIPPAAVAAGGEGPAAGCLPGGICVGRFLPGGCVCLTRGCTPPVNRMTDACENITFPRHTIKALCATNDI